MKNNHFLTTVSSDRNSAVESRLNIFGFRVHNVRGMCLCTHGEGSEVWPQVEILVKTRLLWNRQLLTTNMTAQRATHSVLIFTLYVVYFTFVYLSRFSLWGSLFQSWGLLPAGHAWNTFPGRCMGGILNRCWTTSTGSSWCGGAAVLLWAPSWCLNYSFYLIARHTSVWKLEQSTDHMIHDRLLCMTSEKSTVIRWPTGFPSSRKVQASCWTAVLALCYMFSWQNTQLFFALYIITIANQEMFINTLCVLWIKWNRLMN